MRWAEAHHASSARICSTTRRGLAKGMGQAGQTLARIVVQRAVA